MKFASIILVAMIIACASVSSVRADEDDGKVIVLNPDNFQSVITSNLQTLVEFYAPWCGHCKALAPEYKTASEELDGAGAGVLAKVDCTEHRDLCSQYDVKGFPTIKLFRGNTEKTTEYDQARKAKSIVSWMKRQAQPAVTILSGAGAVAEFAAGEPVKVVAFVNSEAELTDFRAVAQDLRNEYSFGAVVGDSSANSDFKVTAPGVVVIRDFDEGNVVFPGFFGEANFATELTSFIKAQSFPAVGEIGPENYHRYLERGFNFVWLFVDMKDDAQKSLVENVVTPVAKQNRDKLSFVKLDGVRWGEHAKSFGLSGNTPGIVIEDREKGKNFIFPEGTEVTQDAFSQFISDYFSGKLVPHLKSEPVPENNNEPVTVLVGKNFEEIVFDNEKDVLVEFYAPWCGHCKKLTPIYDELGKKFSSDANVVIAKVDATANDTPEKITGFPTIKFYPAGSKQNPIEYDRARTAEEMAAFINENRKSSPPSGAGHEEL